MSIGTSSRAKDFVEQTEFPIENLFADPENLCYDRAMFNKSLDNFSQKSTPMAIMERFQKDGAADLIDVFVGGSL